MNPRRIALMVVLMLACAAASAAPAFHAEDVTGAGYGGPLHLDDAEGRRRDLAEFRGRVVLLFFGFTYCPDICPTEMARLVELRHRLGADAAKVQVIFVTLDPERDSAAVMREYAPGFDPSFIGLRGTRAEVDAAARAFRVFHQRIKGSAPDRYTIDHSAYIYALDPMGRTRLRFDPAHTVEHMAADVRALLAGR